MGLIISVTRLKIKVGWYHWNKRENYDSLYYINYSKAGFKVGLISTVKILVDDVEYKATHTTPDSITINHYLAEMIDSC
jgi:UDP-N-acetylmuramoyl-L-alanyl-D-glutamate--2,6-diaminopimelate ligase